MSKKTFHSARDASSPYFSEMKISSSRMFSIFNSGLYFELKNGKNAHLVLIGDGKICNYDTKTAWIEMDKRIYRILLEALREE